MQQSPRRSFAAHAVVVTTALLALLGCSEDDEARSESKLDAADQLTNGDPGHSVQTTPGGSCVALGQDCSHSDCCEGSCSQSVCQLASSAALCAALGESCSARDCCAGACQGSVCVERASCVEQGGDCSERDCCEGLACAGRVCG